ncbi:MAG: FtsQ-type POTRA domain-containing protein [Oceanospirillales bacterium]|uniref:Cell division protein FtsQ n=1 Tax=Marinobacterium halophilum TaxID=267374 RepID=A0A2P8F4H8_9GAMM|nr:cell division protein FtsQ/DivIB [Marinobacterium halophilum]MBR9828033.1 FtsQ-type POTRA domain-containing protein [Oceanospirillales bacterium]PSL16624.1 cell division protein FtsQ [Marinobacterium halophilum]
MTEASMTAESGLDRHWRAVVILTLLVVFVGIGSSLLRELWHWLNQPVAEVRIAGATRHLDKVGLAQQLAAGLDRPLLQLDLQALQEQLVQDPWVYSASIRRQWPPALEVQLEEEVPVARWGDKGLLNHQGDIFWPALKPEYAALPRLTGPAHETVRIMQQFHDLNRMFSAAGLHLTGLVLESRGAWTLELDNGIRVVAGREQLVPRLKRFIRIYRLSLVDRADQIEQVDIRYTNGVAVSWRAETGKNDAG